MSLEEEQRKVKFTRNLERKISEKSENELIDQEYKKLFLTNQDERSLVTGQRSLYQCKKKKINIFILLFVIFVILLIILEERLKELTIWVKLHIAGLYIFKNKLPVYFNINEYLYLKRFVLLLIYNHGNIFACFMYILLDNLGIILSSVFKITSGSLFSCINIVSLVLIVYMLFLFIKHFLFKRLNTPYEIGNLKKNLINSFILIILILFTLLIIFGNFILTAQNDVNNQFLFFCIYSVCMALFVVYLFFDIFEFELYSDGFKSAKQFYFFIKWKNCLKIIFFFLACSSCLIVLVNVYWYNDKSVKSDNLLIANELNQTFFLLGCYSSFCLEFYFIFHKNYFYFSKYNFSLINKSSYYGSVTVRENILNLMSDRNFNNTSTAKSVIRLLIFFIADFGLLNYFNQVNYPYIWLDFLFNMFEGFLLFLLLKQFFRVSFINLTNESLFEDLEKSMLNVTSRNSLDNYYLFLEKSSSSEEKIESVTMTTNVPNKNMSGSQFQTYNESKKNTRLNWMPVQEDYLEDREDQVEIQVFYRDLEEESEDEDEMEEEDEKGDNNLKDSLI